MGSLTNYAIKDGPCLEDLRRIFREKGSAHFRIQVLGDIWLHIHTMSEEKEKVVLHGTSLLKVGFHVRTTDTRFFKLEYYPENVVGLRGVARLILDPKERSINVCVQ